MRAYGEACLAEKHKVGPPFAGNGELVLCEVAEEIMAGVGVELKLFVCEMVCAWWMCVCGCLQGPRQVPFTSIPPNRSEHAPQAANLHNQRVGGQHNVHHLVRRAGAVDALVPVGQSVPRQLRHLACEKC